MNTLTNCVLVIIGTMAILALITTVVVVFLEVRAAVKKKFRK